MIILPLIKWKKWEFAFGAIVIHLVSYTFIYVKETFEVLLVLTILIKQDK